MSDAINLDQTVGNNVTSMSLSDRMKPWVAEALAPYAAERIEWDLVAGFHPEMGAVLNLIMWVPTGIVGQVGNHAAIIQGPTGVERQTFIDMVRQNVEEVLKARSADLVVPASDVANGNVAVADLLRGKG